MNYKDIYHKLDNIVDSVIRGIDVIDKEATSNLVFMIGNICGRFVSVGTTSTCSTQPSYSLSQPCPGSVLLAVALKHFILPVDLCLAV